MREREITHIATGTYPQPRGWTTPSSSWRALGWWRWPPKRDSPLWQGARTGLDWFSVATEASGGGTPDLFCSVMFLGYVDIYRRKKSVRGAMRRPRGRGRAPPSWWPQKSSGPPPVLCGLLLVQKWSPWSFRSIGLRLIFLFCDTLKQGKKQKLALGSRLIG